MVYLLIIVAQFTSSIVILYSVCLVAIFIIVVFKHKVIVSLVFFLLSDNILGPKMKIVIQ